MLMIALWLLIVSGALGVPMTLHPPKDGPLIKANHAIEVMVDNVGEKSLDFIDMEVLDHVQQESGDLTQICLQLKNTRNNIYVGSERCFIERFEGTKLQLSSWSKDVRIRIFSLESFMSSETLKIDYSLIRDSASRQTAWLGNWEPVYNFNIKHHYEKFKILQVLELKADPPQIIFDCYVPPENYKKLFCLKPVTHTIPKLLGIQYLGKRRGSWVSNFERRIDVKELESEDGADLTHPFVDDLILSPLELKTNLGDKCQLVAIHFKNHNPTYPLYAFVFNGEPVIRADKTESCFHVKPADSLPGYKVKEICQTVSQIDPHHILQFDLSLRDCDLENRLNVKVPLLLGKRSIDRIVMRSQTKYSLSPTDRRTNVCLEPTGVNVPTNTPNCFDTPYSTKIDNPLLVTFKLFTGGDLFAEFDVTIRPLTNPGQDVTDITNEVPFNAVDVEFAIAGQSGPVRELTFWNVELYDELGALITPLNRNLCHKRQKEFRCFISPSITAASVSMCYSWKEDSGSRSTCVSKHEWSTKMILPVDGLPESRVLHVQTNLRDKCTIERLWFKENASLPGGNSGYYKYKLDPANSEGYTMIANTRETEVCISLRNQHVPVCQPFKPNTISFTLSNKDCAIENGLNWLNVELPLEIQSKQPMSFTRLTLNMDNEPTYESGRTLMCLKVIGADFKDKTGRLLNQKNREACRYISRAQGHSNERSEIQIILHGIETLRLKFKIDISTPEMFTARTLPANNVTFASFAWPHELAFGDLVKYTGGLEFKSIDFEDKHHSKQQISPLHTLCIQFNDEAQERICTGRPSIEPTYTGISYRWKNHTGNPLVWSHTRIPWNLERPMQIESDLPVLELATNFLRKCTISDVFFSGPPSPNIQLAIYKISSLKEKILVYNGEEKICIHVPPTSQDNDNLPHCLKFDPHRTKMTYSLTHGECGIEPGLNWLDATLKFDHVPEAIRIVSIALPDKSKEPTRNGITARTQVCVQMLGDRVMNQDTPFCFFTLQQSVDDLVKLKVSFDENGSGPKAFDVEMNTKTVQDTHFNSLTQEITFARFEAKQRDNVVMELTQENVGILTITFLDKGGQILIPAKEHTLILRMLNGKQVYMDMPNLTPTTVKVAYFSNSATKEIAETDSVWGDVMVVRDQDIIRTMEVTTSLGKQCTISKIYFKREGASVDTHVMTTSYKYKLDPKATSFTTLTFTGESNICATVRPSTPLAEFVLGPFEHCQRFQYAPNFTFNMKEDECGVVTLAVEISGLDNVKSSKFESVIEAAQENSLLCISFKGHKIPTLERQCIDIPHRPTDPFVHVPLTIATRTERIIKTKVIINTLHMLRKLDLLFRFVKFDLRTSTSGSAKDLEVYHMNGYDYQGARLTASRVAQLCYESNHNDYRCIDGFMEHPVSVIFCYKWTDAESTKHSRCSPLTKWKESADQTIILSPEDTSQFRTLNIDSNHACTINSVFFDTPIDPSKFERFKYTLNDGLGRVLLYTPKVGICALVVPTTQPYAVPTKHCQPFELVSGALQTVNFEFKETSCPV